MNRRLGSLAGLFLLAAGCNSEVSFCIQYYNGTDLQVRFQGFDSKDDIIDGSDVSIAPVDDNGCCASPLIGLTATPPVTFAGPFALGDANCQFTPVGGHTYIIQVTPDGSFNCYDDGSGRCEAAAVKPIVLGGVTLP